jgi:RNA polymerase sigma factor (sigma-70 family)
MASGQLTVVLRHLRNLIRLRPVEDLSDGQLLEHFIDRQDEAAFEALVQRHAPLVLSVCRRVLLDEHEAEDAFQATFLVLAKKAASIQKQDSVASWLYGVAYRVASQARMRAAVRRAHERQAGERGRVSAPSGHPRGAHAAPLAGSVDCLPEDHPMSGDPVAEVGRRELRAVLDDELYRLPEKYRAPLVLCYLEGKTNEEAAQQLQWATGTLKSRLIRGRELLRDRLAHRGLALSSAALVTTLTASAASATVPAALVENTVRAAMLFAAGKATAAGVVSAEVVALAQGMLRAMMMNHLKLAAMILLAVGVLGTGASFLFQPTAVAQAPGAAQAQPAQPAQAAEEKKAGTDLYGDDLPPGAVARMGTLRWRHGGAVTFVAFLPDGKGLLTASTDGTLRLWDVDSGKEVRRFGQAQAAAGGVGGGFGGIAAGGAIVVSSNVGLGNSGLALAPSGKVLATSAGNAVTLYEVDTGKELRRIQPVGNAAAALAFAPDSKTLAVKGFDQAIRFFDVESGKQIRELKENQGGPRGFGFFGSAPGLVFSPDGKTIATAASARDNQQLSFSIKLWDVEGGKELRQIKLDQRGVSSLTFSPDGKLLAFGTANFGGGSGIHLYDPDTGKEIRQLEGHTNGVGSVVFSPDGKKLASRGMYDPQIRLWDVETGKETGKLGEPAAGNRNGVFFVGGVGAGKDLAFSPDGKILASGGSNNTVRLWELASGKERAGLGGHSAAVASIVLASDGKTLISRGADNTLRRWEAASGKQLSQFNLPEGTTTVAISADGQTVAAGAIDTTIRLLEAATGKELHKLQGHQNGTAALAFSADGKLLASRGNGDNTIRLYDVAKGNDLRQIAIAPDDVNKAGVIVVNGAIYGGGGAGLAFSPDGRYVASPGAGQTIRLWDVVTGKEARQIALPKQRGVGSFTFSPDGRILATENFDGTISLWEVASGRECGMLGKPPAGQPGRPGVNVQAQIMIAGMPAWGMGGAGAATLAFSPDGRFLVARGNDQSVRLWDVAAAQEVKQFKGHQGGVATVAYAPDGKTVASGSQDTTVLVWDVRELHARPRPAAVELPAKEVETLWADLQGDDAVKAVKAVRTLVTSPKSVVPFLGAQLKPAVPVDASKIDKWIADLDSEKFAVRKQAAEELEKLGPLARQALEDVLKGQPSLEVRKRAETLLEKLTGGNLSADDLRLTRAVWVLEETGTPEAKQVLETLAKGAPGALPTREAKEALQRLGRGK